ncbi:MAG TPA: hypothetical protein VMV84_04615 [Dehalococcoidales bacterium]|nr:hypothetical protein [Dehalococcoidales bacterium]
MSVLSIEVQNKGGQGAREIMAGFSFPRSLPVQCGAMTGIWVSVLPPKEVPIGSK